MSSLRNAVKRVTHKERSQPRHRAHLGILEKKRDYQERARDYHKKQDVLKAMRQRASMKNPDEFYFAMKSSTTNQNGKHVKTEALIQKERDLGPDTIRILKDQDLSYVRLQKQQNKKKMERLSENLHFSEAQDKKRKHTVFVDNEEQANNFEVADHFDTVPELAGRAFNRVKKKDLSDLAQHLSSRRKQMGKKLAKARSAAYGELQARAIRVKALGLAEAHLETEKLVAGRGRKRKIKEAENGKPAQYKWRRKRAK